MSIAITEDHRTLAATATDVLAKHDALGSARALLAGADESLPAFWDDVAALGWLGLHVPEEHGGSGYGIEELAVVVEQLGRTVTPGPFVPTALAITVGVSGGSTQPPVPAHKARTARLAASRPRFIRKRWP